MQTQALGVAIVLHISSVAQLPQGVELPQAFETIPHALLPHVGVGQVHELFWHTSSVLHPPHVTVRWAPQRSVTVMSPQVALFIMHNCVSVSGTHWQVLLVQFSLAPHEPQSKVRDWPQLSMPVTEPHCAPCAMQKAASV